MQKILLVVAVATLSACGGGSSGSSSAPSPAPTPTPVINTAPEASNVVLTPSAYGPRVTTMLSAGYDYLDADSDEEGSSVIRWLRDGVAISDAVDKTYLLASDDEGAAITFEVTPVAKTGELQGQPITSNSVTVLENSAPVAEDLIVTLSHDGPWVSTEVSASYNYTDLDNNAEGISTFRWLRDGEAIADATTEKYTLHTIDADKSITVEVTPVATSGVLLGAPVESAAIMPKINRPPVVNQVRMNLDSTGPWVGTGVYASYDYSDADGDVEGATTFRWFRNGVAITGATKKEYMLQQDDAGTTVAVEVTPVASSGILQGNAIFQGRGYIAVVNTVPVASDLEIKVNGKQIDSSGIKVGRSLSVQFRYLDAEDDLPGGHQIRWLLDGIEESVEQRFTPATEHVGKSLQVEVTPKASEGNPIGLAVLSSAEIVRPLDKKIFTAIDDDGIRKTMVTDGSADNTLVLGDLTWNKYREEIGTPIVIINDSLGNDISSPKWLFQVGNNKLAITDGTVSGTQELVVGRADGRVRELIAFNGLAFFNSPRTEELWVTDGTEAGTQLFADIFPGDWASSPRDLTVVGEKLYFTAINRVASDGLGDRELFVTDGDLSVSEDARVQQVKDIYVGDKSSYPRDFIAFNDSVYFSAYSADQNGDSIGRELWKTDGTESGTLLVKDFTVVADYKGSDPSNLTVVGNSLFMTVRTSDSNSNENQLWVLHKGASELVKVSGLNSSDIANAVVETSGLTAAGDRLYFIYRDGFNNGDDLYYVKAGQQVATKVAFNIGGTTNVSKLKELNGQLIVQAERDTVGKELFFVNSSDKIELLKDIVDGNADGNPEQLSVLNDHLIFSATDQAGDTELWKTDGTTAGTQQLKNIRTSGSSEPILELEFK